MAQANFSLGHRRVALRLDSASVPANVPLLFESLLVPLAVLEHRDERKRDAEQESERRAAEEVFREHLLDLGVHHFTSMQSMFTSTNAPSSLRALSRRFTASLRRALAKDN